MSATDARGFQAWRINDGAPLTVDIPTSPVGRISISTWRSAGARKATRVPAGGSAMILPIALTAVSWPGVDARIAAGCYAQVPGGCWLYTGAGLIIHTPDYVGLLQVGGPVEETGRLNYIDGCSDSLLVCPATVGDPCLNLLHLPPRVDQTQHTHPSERVGIILSGGGECRTPDGVHPLTPGMFWCIPTGTVHSFHTGPDPAGLNVLAWHPDSDFGPSHDSHPMLNRTMVGGAPASAPQNQGIRTSRETGRAS